MIQLHFGVKQLKIGKAMGVLHLFAWNYVKYANMEGFRRDSHISTTHYTMDVHLDEGMGLISYMIEASLLIQFIIEVYMCMGFITTTTKWLRYAIGNISYDTKVTWHLTNQV